MTTLLTATVEPPAGDDQSGDCTVTLRISNVSGSTAEVLNPDIGRPSPQMNWPWSTAAYRASLLMSYGYLTVQVHDESGEQMDKQPLETWATPVLRPHIALAPGDSLEVPIPLGRFFPLAPGTTYRVSIEYGDDTMKIRVEGTVGVQDRSASSHADD